MYPCSLNMGTETRSFFVVVFDVLLFHNCAGGLGALKFVDGALPRSEHIIIPATPLPTLPFLSRQITVYVLVSLSAFHVGISDW